MGANEILEQAMNLLPEEKVLIIEALLKSFKSSDPNVDKVWAVEAEKRLNAYREGRLKSVDGFPVFNVSDKSRSFSLRDTQMNDDEV